LAAVLFGNLKNPVVRPGIAMDVNCLDSTSARLFLIKVS
jgi:hypothetical protein